MMDELPAIIHKLSLRLWCPESGAKEEEEMAERNEKQPEKDEVRIDPFSSPPQDAVDARGNVLDANEISSLSLDGGAEIHSLFSQKNLLRLAALTNSHRTLSLFTPSIRDAVFRAWAGPTERDSAGNSTPVTPSLVRSYSTLNSTTYTFTNRSSEDGHMSSRPSLVSLHSATTGLSLGSGRSRSYANRKKKNRVVNLRRAKTTDDIMSESGDSETSSAAPGSEPVFATALPEEPEDNIITPPQSPGRVRFRTSSIDLGDTPRKLRLPTTSRPILWASNVLEQEALELAPSIEKIEPSVSIYSRSHRPSFTSASNTVEKTTTTTLVPMLEPAPVLSDTPGIIEQAWILKMAGEIARRAHDEKAASSGFWSNDEREDTPPPAYQPKA